MSSTRSPRWTFAGARRVPIWHLWGPAATSNAPSLATGTRHWRPTAATTAPRGLEVVAEEGAARPVLAFTLENNDRALLSGSPEARDYRVRARVLPLDAEAHPDSDRE